MNESNAPTGDSDEPRIIVDDDYKSRVEKEKEDLRQQMDAAAGDDDMQMPPASLPVLVTTLATQALSNLGQIPDPIEGKPVIRKPLAKHFIDTLGMLEEKTSGNLTDEEVELFSNTLHQLRMVFVATPDQMPGEATDSAGSGGSSTIELP